MTLPTFEKMRLTGLIGILSFGLTSLLAVLLPPALGPLVPAVFITGFFLLIPLVWLLGDDFPLVASSDGSTDTAATERPIAELRDRYATGEIDEAEFERKLDRLLATEDAETRDDREAPAGDVAARVRENARRELDRLRE